MTDERPTPPKPTRPRVLRDGVGSQTIGRQPGQPYLRATGPEVTTPPSQGADDLARHVRLQLADGAAIYLSERRYPPGGPVPQGWIAEPVGRCTAGKRRSSITLGATTSCSRMRSMAISQVRSKPTGGGAMPATAAASPGRGTA